MKHIVGRPRSRRSDRSPCATRRSPRYRPTLEALEPRNLLAVSTLVAIGADAGGGPQVTLFNRATGAVEQSFFAYDPQFTGGVRVALGDVTGDGTPDIVTAAGTGGGPDIHVYDGNTRQLIESFFAFDPGFTGGVNVALGDVEGTGRQDIIVGADAGGGPQVRVFNGTGKMLDSFFALAPTFTGGVRVAAGDVNGDGKADLVVGAGPGAGPEVRVFNGAQLGQLAAATPMTDFLAYAANFTGGVYVAATDLTGDGKAEIITGAGAGGGPDVHVYDGTTGALLTGFMAYAPDFTGGVRVGAFTLDANGRPAIVTAPGPGGGSDVRLFSAPGGQPSTMFTTLAPGFTGGLFISASGLPSGVGQLSGGSLGNFFASSGSTTTTSTADPLLTLQLQPIDLNLLGLEVQTNQITVTVSAQSGGGELLGNVLTIASNLVNFQGVNNALNNVLGSVVGLLNSASLNVNVGTGPLTNATAGTTPVLDAFIAPVHLNLLGAVVDTTPIHLTITAHSGQGLVLGNVIADLANLFNPPLPNKLNLDFVNGQLVSLLNQLNTQLPGISSAPITPPTLPSGTSQILELTVPPIDLNLLGLLLQTNQIQVNVDSTTGNGDLLGNVLTTLLNTLGATPQNLTALSNNLNALLAKIVGVLNVSTLTISSGALGTLSSVLQTLALPNLVNTTGTPATSPVLDLVVASTDGTTPPVDVNLLGLVVTTSDVHVQLNAQTGDGQVLGNLVYNVSHLLDPGGSLNLLTILNALGV